ncbi:hypothetical protein B566_EDAN003985, partial [Ephemera danica]
KKLRYCAVPYCPTRSDSLISDDGKIITLHEFPSDLELCEKFIKIISRRSETGDTYPHWQPKKKSLICSEHFEAGCFKIQRNGTRRLLESSLPTILPPENPQYLKKPVPLKQRSVSIHDLHLNEDQMPGPAAKKAKLDATPQPEGRSSDGSKCFICDSAMVGKKYSLASCMTNGTKVLGRLVCDNYMVVVSHGDFICRGCANLLNTLDRLDAEITSVKRIVLNFVERKYRLGDRLQAQLTPTPVIYSKTSVGSPLTQTTLMSNKKVSASPAPQTPQSSKPAALSGRPKKTTPTKQAATPLNTKTTAAATPLNTKTTAAATPLNTKTTAAATPPITKTTAAAASTKTNTPRTKSFKITLKDEQILGQSPKILQTAEDQVFNKISAGAGTQANLPRNVWMQCNQCQYTTNQRSVMLEHLRQHVASRSGKDAAKTPASKPTSSSATTTTTTTTTASTSADKTVEATSSTTVTDKTEDAPSTAAEETPTTSADAKNKTPAETKESEKPITITVDANVASGSATPTKQTIIVRQTSESAKSPGIVSKMLAGNKVVAIQNPPPLSTPVVKIITTSKTDTKSKVKVPATPQIFSSTKKKSQPDPSMPSLLGDDDL